MMYRNRNIVIQWHITHRCGNSCKHCYEKNYSGNSQLSLDELIYIFEKVKQFEQKYTRLIFKDIAITGGDPLLHPDWKPFVRHLAENKMRVHILGNPETLTDENIDFLKEAGIALFQLSLDGLPEFHDYLRYPGSFENTVEAVKGLSEKGIKTGVMFTMFKENSNQLLPLIEYLNDNVPVDYFSFDFGVLFSENEITNKFTPDEIKGIFNKYLDRQKDSRIRLLLKHSYLKLLKLEREGVVFNPRSGHGCSGGCLIGSSLCINSSGDAGLCARLPVFIGNLLEQDIEAIFLRNETIKKFRRRENYPVCGTCRYFQICRGCPALGRSVNGNEFESNVFCFAYDKIEGKKKWKIKKNTSIKEEYEILIRQ